MQNSNKPLFLLIYTGKRTGGSIIPVFISECYRFLDQIQSGIEKLLTKTQGLWQQRKKVWDARSELGNQHFVSTFLVILSKTVGIFRCGILAFPPVKTGTCRIFLHATSSGYLQRALCQQNSGVVCFFLQLQGLLCSCTLSPQHNGVLNGAKISRCCCGTDRCFCN